MLPWAAFAPQSTSLLRARAIGRLPCLSKCRRVAVPLTISARHASAHVSPTAINVRPNVPPQNKELYNALSALSKSAEAYANISRLQLALRSLAAQDAVTRVAGMFVHALHSKKVYGLWVLMHFLCSAVLGKSNQRAEACQATSRRSVGLCRAMGDRHGGVRVGITRFAAVRESC